MFDRTMDPRMRRVQQKALEAKRREVTAQIAERFIKKSAEKLRAEGIPLTENGDARIDMTAFDRSTGYGLITVTKDQTYVRQLKEKFRQEAIRNRGQADDESDKKLKQGERLEILKTALFQKHLGNDFIVVRSSEYDDLANGVDNVIVDRKSGNVLCAFDEVGEDVGPVYEEKRKRITDKNQFNGAKLKYGFSFDATHQLVLRPIDNIPIFYLAMSPDNLEQALQSFDSQSTNELEKNTFQAFLRSIIEQINDFVGSEAQVTPLIKEKAGAIRSVLLKYQE